MGKWVCEREMKLVTFAVGGLMRSGVNLSTPLPHGTVGKSSESYESGLENKGGDTTNLCASCGFKRGDWVSTLW